MENDPKTLLMQLISNLELAEMRAQRLRDPETGFSQYGRLRLIPDLVGVMLQDMRELLQDEFPSDAIVNPTVIRLHNPLEGIDYRQEQANCIAEQDIERDLQRGIRASELVSEHLIKPGQEITRGLGVPKEFYDPPTHSE